MQSVEAGLTARYSQFYWFVLFFLNTEAIFTLFCTLKIWGSNTKKSHNSLLDLYVNVCTMLQTLHNKVEFDNLIKVRYAK